MNRERQRLSMDKKQIGAALSEIRAKKDLSVYKASKNGNIRISQVQAVEKGEANYTIDVLLGYLQGVGAELTITEK